MGTVDRLRNIVEPFAALFLGSWRCTCQHLTLPRWPGITRIEELSWQFLMQVSSIHTSQWSVIFDLNNFANPFELLAI